MANNRFDVDVDKVVQKVYHTDELKKIMEDITTQFINEVVLMSDTELNEDRSEWIKMYGRQNDDDEEMYYHTAVQTLAIEIEQLRRFKKIVYINPKQITEDQAAQNKT
jgi:predicted transcriptional regulator